MTRIAFSVVCFALAAMSARAEDFPLPQSDFAVTMTVAGAAAPAVQRHHEGTLRIESPVQGQAATVLVDLRKSSAVLLMDMGGQKIAMEVTGGKTGMPLPVKPANATKGGRDTVAGEACDLWSFDNPLTKAKDTACVTPDGVSLRIVSNGKVASVATAIDRSPQNPALFVVPPGYKRMAMPGGLPGMAPNRPAP